MTISKKDPSHHNELQEPVSSALKDDVLELQISHVVTEASLKPNMLSFSSGMICSRSSYV